MSFLKRVTLQQIIDMYDEVSEHLIGHVKHAISCNNLTDLDRMKIKEIYGVWVKTLIYPIEDDSPVMTVKMVIFGSRNTIMEINPEKLEGLNIEDICNKCRLAAWGVLLKYFKEVVDDYFSTMIPEVIQDPKPFWDYIAEIHPGFRFYAFPNGYEYYCQTKTGKLIRHWTVNESSEELQKLPNGMAIDLSLIKARYNISNEQTPQHSKPAYSDIISKLKDDLVTLVLLKEIELPKGLHYRYSDN